MVTSHNCEILSILFVCPQNGGFSLNNRPQILRKNLKKEQNSDTNSDVEGGDVDDPLVLLVVAFSLSCSSLQLQRRPKPARSYLCPELVSQPDNRGWTNLIQWGQQNNLGELAIAGRCIGRNERLNPPRYMQSWCFSLCLSFSCHLLIQSYLCSVRAGWAPRPW